MKQIKTRREAKDMKMSYALVRHIKEGVDIIQVMSFYGINFRAQGNRDNYIGRCPWHNDRVASLSVSRSKGLYHCFGCGESGNVFSLVIKMEKLTFSQAVERLAEIAGISLNQ
jgi:DNA primase